MSDNFDTFCMEHFGKTGVECREEVKLDARRECMPQVEALIDAGWQFELPDIGDSEPWQWYWRRPARRKTGKGRKFWSTNQAFSTLKREQGSGSPDVAASTANGPKEKGCICLKNQPLEEKYGSK